MLARTVALIAVLGWSAMARSDPTIVVEPTSNEPVADSKVPADPTQRLVYMCPMDPDVHSDRAGKCRRCGMTLVTGVPEPVEFHVDVVSLPASPQPGRPAVLQYAVHDPWKNRPVSQDLEFFVPWPSIAGGQRSLPVPADVSEARDVSRAWRFLSARRAAAALE